MKSGKSKIPTAKLKKAVEQVVTDRKNEETKKEAKPSGGKNDKNNNSNVKAKESDGKSRKK
jgi:hypothetical protein